MPVQNCRGIYWYPVKAIQGRHRRPHLTRQVRLSNDAPSRDLPQHQELVVVHALGQQRVDVAVLHQVPDAEHGAQLGRVDLEQERVVVAELEMPARPLDRKLAGAEQGHEGRRHAVGPVEVQLHRTLELLLGLERRLGPRLEGLARVAHAPQHPGHLLAVALVARGDLRRLGRQHQHYWCHNPSKFRTETEAVGPECASGAITFAMEPPGGERAFRHVGRDMATVESEGTAVELEVKRATLLLHLDSAELVPVSGSAHRVIGPALPREELATASPHSNGGRTFQLDVEQQTMKLAALVIAAVLATTSVVAAESPAFRALADVPTTTTGKGVPEANAMPTAGAPTKSGDKKEWGWGGPWGWGGGWGRPWGCGGGWGGGWGSGCGGGWGWGCWQTWYRRSANPCWGTLPVKQYVACNKPCHLDGTMKLAALVIAAVLATTSVVAAESPAFRALADVPTTTTGKGVPEANAMPTAGAPTKSGDKKEWG
ncbi:hypothetical protein ON010_g2580 [Phytophthora cinnamomi]|nr:hypothetical protein ON010_g2580 [Phytophthora cinnamomi]